MCIILTEKNNKDDFTFLIETVNLNDITLFIWDLFENYVSAYWKPKNDPKNNCVYIGDMEWAIFSYLTAREIIKIKDIYYGYNKDRTEEYIGQWNFYNPLTKNLYVPIINRLTKEKYLEECVKKPYYDTIKYDLLYYRVHPNKMREIKLNRILNENRIY